jgi:hypothetical protein
MGSRQLGICGATAETRLNHPLRIPCLLVHFLVRWIDTQDHLFKDFAFQQFIEIGPSPTLTGMAARTLKAKYEAQDDSITHAPSFATQSTARKSITSLKMSWLLPKLNQCPKLPLLEL